MPNDMAQRGQYLAKLSYGLREYSGWCPGGEVTCAGKYISDQLADSLDDCQKACDNTVGCAAVSWKAQKQHMHSGHCVLRGATPKSSKILSSHRQATGGSESIDGWQCFERQDKCTRMLAWVDQKDLVMLPGGIGQMEKNWNFIRMSKMDEGAYEMIVEYHIEPHLVRHNIEHFLISFCH